MMRWFTALPLINAVYFSTSKATFSGKINVICASGRRKKKQTAPKTGRTEENWHANIPSHVRWTMLHLFCSLNEMSRWIQTQAKIYSWSPRPHTVKELLLLPPLSLRKRAENSTAAVSLNRACGILVMSLLVLIITGIWCWMQTKETRILASPVSIGCFLFVQTPVTFFFTAQRRRTLHQRKMRTLWLWHRNGLCTSQCQHCVADMATDLNRSAFPCSRPS